MSAYNHVAVSVSVRSGAKVGRIWRKHGFDQMVGICRIGIGMAASKVRKRLGVDRRAGSGPEQLFEDALGVRPSNGVHSVEMHAKTRAKQLSNGFEIKESRLQVGPL